MMRSRDPISIDAFRSFTPEVIAERLQRLYSEGQPGIVFCNYWHYNDLMYSHENHRYQNVPWMMFGRDIFGKQSLCYRITGNTIEVRRIPGQIYAGWREVPQGVVVIIRHDDIARNGINYNDHEMKKLMLQFTFKDLYMAECHLFYFVKNEAVTMFKERLQNSIEMVTMIPVFGCNDLLEINQEILPEEEVQMMLENTVEEFIDLFKKIMPRYLSIRLQQTTEKISSPLLFLFSGGVDSLFVAMMASCMAEEKYEFVLVNVSFSEDGNDFELAPDRKRGFAAYNFLKERFPERVFHFLRVDVTKDELQRERTSSIAKAISPGSSVLDDSIGCVVWFASRARGTVDGIEKDYERATHVFVGSGSDEILGGYSRHRGRFQREGYEGLFDELRLELENIGNRNLGRDDRVALSNDRIILAPFLDEDVVRFVNRLPIQLKVDFSKPRGIGEKIVLREALKKLGCPENLYTAPKKAMQFGTRIAKLEDRREKGSDICARLKAADNDGIVADCL